ncbi:hypothetical protein ScPMuIL_009522 [Solemya velum]
MMTYTKLWLSLLVVIAVGNTLTLGQDTGGLDEEDEASETVNSLLGTPFVAGRMAIATIDALEAIALESTDMASNTFGAVSTEVAETLSALLGAGSGDGIGGTLTQFSALLNIIFTLFDFIS